MIQQGIGRRIKIFHVLNDALHFFCFYIRMHDETHWLAPKEPDGSLSSDNFLQHMVHSCIAALSFSATRAMCDDCSNPKSGSTRKY